MYPNAAFQLVALRLSRPLLTRLLRSLCQPEQGQAARDCWSVSFGNSYDDAERCVCAGYDNGDVKLFDLRTNSLRWEANVSNGVTCVEFDRPDIEMNKMCVTTLESKFRCYDLRTQHAVSGFAGLSERAHKSTVWLCRHLPQVSGHEFRSMSRECQLTESRYFSLRVLLSLSGRRTGTFL